MNLLEMTKDFYFLAKVAKFCQIRSHWVTRHVNFVIKFAFGKVIPNISRSFE